MHPGNPVELSKNSPPDGNKDERTGFSQTILESGLTNEPILLARLKIVKKYFSCFCESASLPCFRFCPVAKLAQFGGNPPPASNRISPG